MVEQRPGSGETMRRIGLGVGLAIGMGVGVALGVALHNMGTGLALGLVFGAAVMVLFTWAGTRLQRDEQRRRAEDGPEAATGHGGEDARRDAVSDAEPDQPSTDSRDAGA
ncbi:hypothetical protein [Microbacterium sp. 8M]|uniref:hypothetical protein n=1 Tax=Microbacterium sp. 8M TaxID=2653153 RepID=UPI00135C1CE8|nr:hypothetical protein [Microbacterium sp. 8M]